MLYELVIYQYLCIVFGAKKWDQTPQEAIFGVPLAPF